MKRHNLYFISMLVMLLSYQAHATNPPPYVDNSISTQANLAGSGGSISTATSAIEIQGTKSGTVLDIQGTTLNHATNISNGGGSGSASANSTLQGIKTGRMDPGGYGQVGIQSVSGAAAGKNQDSQVVTGARSTLTVTNTGGKLTEVKQSLSEAQGVGNVTAKVTAGATFNTVRLQGVVLPPLPSLRCPTL